MVGTALNKTQLDALNAWYAAQKSYVKKPVAPGGSAVGGSIGYMTALAKYNAAIKKITDQYVIYKSSASLLNDWYKLHNPQGPEQQTPQAGNNDNGQGADGDPAQAAEDAANEQAQNNAADYLKQLFAQYGLTGLDDEILKLVKGGITDAASVTLMLSDTPQYKERFAANEERKAKGWKVYSPAEYLDLEDQFRSIMIHNGLPSGFYDQNSDFEKWIAGDVSPTEINDRIGIANDAVLRSDPQYLDALSKMGLNTGDMMAAVLDTTRAYPILKKLTMSAEIGAEANRAGVSWNVDRANYLQGLGVTQADARQGYGIVANDLGTAQDLGQRFGQQYGQSDLEQDWLVEKGMGPASAKRKSLGGMEQAAFSGTTGYGKNSSANKNRGEY